MDDGNKRIMDGFEDPMRDYLPNLMFFVLTLGAYTVLVMRAWS